MSAVVDLDLILGADYNFAVVYKTIAAGVTTPVDISGYTVFLEFSSSKNNYAENILCTKNLVGASGEVDLYIPSLAIDELYDLNTRRWRLRLTFPYVAIVPAYGGVNFDG